MENPNEVIKQNKETILNDLGIYTTLLSHPDVQDNLDVLIDELGDSLFEYLEFILSNTDYSEDDSFINAIISWMSFEQNSPIIKNLISKIYSEEVQHWKTKLIEILVNRVFINKDLPLDLKILAANYKANTTENIQHQPSIEIPTGTQTKLNIDNDILALAGKLGISITEVPGKGGADYGGTFLQKNRTEYFESAFIGVLDRPEYNSAINSVLIFLLGKLLSGTSDPSVQSQISNALGISTEELTQTFLTFNGLFLRHVKDALGPRVTVYETNSENYRENISKLINLLESDEKQNNRMVFGLLTSVGNSIEYASVAKISTELVTNINYRKSLAELVK